MEPMGISVSIILEICRPTFQLSYGAWGPQGPQESDFDNLNFSREVGTMAVAGSSMRNCSFHHQRVKTRPHQLEKPNNGVRSGASLQVFRKTLAYLLCWCWFSRKKIAKFWQDTSWSGMLRLNVAESLRILWVLWCTVYFPNGIQRSWLSIAA